MSDGSGASVFQVAIEARSEDYHAGDERWRSQVIGLYDALREQVDVTRRGHTVGGAKGTIDELVIALGSSGAFTAAIECFRAWLRRDRGRRIDMRWNENGVERFVTLTGEAIDAESVREIAKAAAYRIGGSAWPAGTEPS